MTLEEGLGSFSNSVTAKASGELGNFLRGRSDDSVGHLLEPQSCPTVPKSASGRGSTGAADFDKKTAFISRLSEQLAALATLVRPTRPNGEREPQESSSAGSASLPTQQLEPPLKYLTLAAGLLTCIWGWRAARSIERIVSRRYSDIAYQIRRPDALSARISAFKFLVLGGLVLPGSAVAFASLHVEAPQLAGQVGDPQEADETPKLPLNITVPRRVLLAEILPVNLQVDMRRLVSFASSVA